MIGQMKWKFLASTITIILLINFYLFFLRKRLHLFTFTGTKLLPKDSFTNINDRMLQSFYPKSYLSHKKDETEIIIFSNKNYFKRIFSKDSIVSKISIITQCTEERLQRLEDLTQVYSGPISITYFISQNEDVEMTLKKIHEKFPNILPNVFFHIFRFRDPHVFEYRINEMRNISWKFVDTEFVFIMDLDFFPSSNFDKEINKFSKTDLFKEYIEGNKGFLSLASFEWKCKDTKSFSFQNCVRDQPLLSNHPSQRATDWVKWEESKTAYEVDYQLFYEPYGIGSSKMTIFDPIFLYGNDKTSFFYELAAQKFKFFVLPNAFIGHLPHLKTFNQRYVTSLGIRRFKLFEHRIRQQYGFNYLCDENNLKKKYHFVGSHSCICYSIPCEE
jgi:hypothetical protein